MTPRCYTRLHEVHPDLQKVILKAEEMYDGEFIVTEGKRTIERQKELVAKGASKTMRSRHVPNNNVCGVPCAVDLAVMVGDEVRWDTPLYVNLMKVVKSAAEIVGVPVEAGGDWKTFKDYPHYQLPWKHYP